MTLTLWRKPQKSIRTFGPHTHGFEGFEASSLLSSLRWDSLSVITKSGKQRMRLRHALLKLAYFGPNDRILTSADCRKLLVGKDMQGKVDQCEAILSELHDITKKHTCSKEKSMQLVGMAECKVVATLLQKKHRDISWSFDSMEEAASEFVELFGKEVGKTLACSFAATPKKEAAAPSRAPTSSSGVGKLFGGFNPSLCQSHSMSRRVQAWITLYT